MPSIQRSKSLTMSFYIGLADKYSQLTSNGKSSSEAVKICAESSTVSSQTVSDARLFLRFPSSNEDNKSAYKLHENEICASSTLVCIFKAAKKLNRKSTRDVVISLTEHYKLEGKNEQTVPRRGGGFQLSQNDVKKWMKKDAITK